MSDMRLRTTLFVVLTASAAAWIVAAAGRPTGPVATLFIWFLACLAGEAFWIRTPTHRGTISMALTINVAALFTLSPAASLCVIGASTLLAGIYPHRRAWYKVLFNAAQATLAAAAGLVILSAFRRTPDPSGHLYAQMTWLPLFAAGVVFFLVNSGLVASAIAFSSGVPVWRAWRENYGYGFEVWCTIAQVSLSGFVLTAYQQMGPVAVLGLLPVLGVLWWSSAREAGARGSRRDTSGEEEPEKMKLAG